MEIRYILPVLSLSVLVLSSACSTTGGSLEQGNARGSNDASAGSVSANIVGDAAVGDTVQLPAGNPLGASSADILAEYFAASNRLCRQVLPSGGYQGADAALGGVRLACERDDGTWEWVRPLTQSSVLQPLPAVASVAAVESH